MGATSTFLSGMLAGALVALLLWVPTLHRIMRRTRLDEAKRRGDTRAIGKAYEEVYRRTHDKLRTEVAARNAGA